MTSSWHYQIMAVKINIVFNKIVRFLSFEINLDHIDKMDYAADLPTGYVNEVYGLTLRVTQAKRLYVRCNSGRQYCKGYGAIASNG